MSEGTGIRGVALAAAARQKQAHEDEQARKLEQRWREYRNRRDALMFDGREWIINTFEIDPLDELFWHDRESEDGTRVSQPPTWEPWYHAACFQIDIGVWVRWREGWKGAQNTVLSHVIVVDFCPGCGKPLSRTGAHARDLASLGVQLEAKPLSGYEAIRHLDRCKAYRHLFEGEQA